MCELQKLMHIYTYSCMYINVNFIFKGVDLVTKSRTFRNLTSNVSLSCVLEITSWSVGMRNDPVVAAGCKIDLVHYAS